MHLQCVQNFSMYTSYIFRSSNRPAYFSLFRRTTKGRAWVDGCLSSDTVLPCVHNFLTHYDTRTTHAGRQAGRRAPVPLCRRCQHDYSSTRAQQHYRTTGRRM